MSPRNKSLLVLAGTSVLTLVAYLIRAVHHPVDDGLLLMWVFCAWNFFAYGFDKDMWPWVWVQLEGGNNGKFAERRFMFLGTALIYMALLATFSFAG